MAIPTLELERLYVRLIGDATSYNAMLAQAQARAQLTAQRLSQIGRMMTFALTTPIVALGIASAKAFATFENNMAKIEGLVGVPRAEVQRFSDEILTMATRFAATPAELSEALYFITSSGFAGQEAMAILEASAISAATGLAEMKPAADVLTSAISSYGRANMTAATALDILIATIREGKGEGPELARTMGRVLPIAATLGVEFNELGAALAVMTRVSGAGIAVTQMRQFLQTFIKPTVGAEERLNQLGTSFSQLREHLKERGLISTLFVLKELLGGDIASIGKVFGNVRALTGLLRLIGPDWEQTQQVFAAMQDTSGGAATAFERAAQTSLFAWKQARAAVMTILILLGEALVPLARTIAIITMRAANAWRAMSREARQNVAVVLSIVAATGPLLIMFGSLNYFLIQGFTTLSKIGFLVYAIAGLFGRFGLLSQLLSPLLSMPLVIAGIGIGVAVLIGQLGGLEPLWKSIKAAAVQAWNAISGAAIIAFLIIRNFGEIASETWNQLLLPAIINVSSQIVAFTNRIAGEMYRWMEANWDTVSSILGIAAAVVGLVVGYRILLTVLSALGVFKTLNLVLDALSVLRIAVLTAVVYAAVVALSVYRAVLWTVTTIMGVARAVMLVYTAAYLWLTMNIQGSLIALRASGAAFRALGLSVGVTNFVVQTLWMTFLVINGVILQLTAVIRGSIAAYGTYTAVIYLLNAAFVFLKKAVLAVWGAYSLWILVLTGSWGLIAAMVAAWVVWNNIVWVATNALTVYRYAVVLWYNAVFIAKAVAKAFYGILLAIRAGTVTLTGVMITLRFVWAAIKSTTLAHTAAMVLNKAAMGALIALAAIGEGAMWAWGVAISGLSAVMTTLAGGIAALVTLISVPAWISFGVTLGLFAVVGTLVGSVLWGIWRAAGAVVRTLGALPTTYGPVATIGAMLLRWWRILVQVVEIFRSGMPDAMEKAWDVLQAGFYLAVQEVAALWPPLWRFIQTGFVALWDVVSLSFQIGMRQAIINVLRQWARLNEGMASFGFGIPGLHTWISNQIASLLDPMALLTPSTATGAGGAGVAGAAGGGLAAAGAAAATMSPAERALAEVLRRAQQTLIGGAQQFALSAPGALASPAVQQARERLERTLAAANRSRLIAAAGGSVAAGAFFAGAGAGAGATAPQLKDQLTKDMEALLAELQTQMNTGGQEAGAGLVEGINKGVQDAVLFGSAEALARLTAYREGVLGAGGREVLFTSPRANAAGIGAAGNQPDRIADLIARSNEFLERIADRAAPGPAPAPAGFAA